MRNYAISFKPNKIAPFFLIFLPSPIPVVRFTNTLASGYVNVIYNKTQNNALKLFNAYKTSSISHSNVACKIHKK
jgi:hypothetical protein